MKGARRFAAASLGLGLVAAVSAAAPGSAQSASVSRVLPASLQLDDLREFRSPPSNWRVAGGVTADRERRHHIATTPGTGVLVNVPGGAGGADLFTSWEHGDLELELDVMMPRGSNSGLYFQGRYELQLLDSWGVRNPTFADMGGIYERWDDSRPAGGRGFEGFAPRMNASRAPGLWQTLQVRFRAPRFDENGVKVENARFVRVVLNGAVIHENVDLSGPTRGSAFPDEAPLGPLRIQGDHGPIAFRNVRYKRFSGAQLGLSELRFAVAEGEFESLAAATAEGPVREGRAEAITSAVAGLQDRFAVRYEGTLHVPTSGLYHFDVELDWIGTDPHFTGRVVGGARLAIGGREVLLNDGLTPVSVGEVELEAGAMPFRFDFFKNRPWTNRLAVNLWAEGPEVERHPLHDPRATPISAPEPIGVEPSEGAFILRGFVRHGDETRTHAAAVGDPTGVHYAFDLATGSLLHVWRGPFVEATDMWHGRGERQLAQPLGSLLSFAGTPAVARLNGPDAPWPDSVPEAEFRPMGYALDADGRPTFRYRIGDLQVQDLIRPAEDRTSLRREIVVAGAGDRVFARLAEGSEIQRLSDGSYSVDDHAYLVELERGAPRPRIRTVGGRQELIVPLSNRQGEARIAYTIVW